MSGLLPMAVYGLEVPAGDVPIPASRPDIPASFRITMAAIDPSADPEGPDGAVPRATLKIIRQPIYDDDDEDDEEFDIDEMERMLAEGGDDEDDDSEDDEEVNGGPSDPAKSKKARKEAAQQQIRKMLEEAEDDSDDAPNGVNGKKSAKARGKMPRSDDDDEDDEDDSDDDEEGAEFEEFVICTLDPEKNYQQPIDITIGDDEMVLFKVSGTHTIYLTGNYVEPHSHNQEEGMYDPDSDEEGDYDLEPDSDELDEDDEEDELDGLDDPRVMEVDEDEDDEMDEAPELIEAPKAKKGKNKRAAEDDALNGASIDELIAKDAKTNGEEAKLSKKQLKKQKKNDGSAAVTATEEGKDAPSSNKKDDKAKAGLGVRKVQGVTIDDKKVGEGPAAKAGDRVGMRYIGKLSKNGQVFDSNKKGKPFSFKLGSGEVIKGWDIGIAGMTVGGERRITIPAHLAYGSKGAGKDIPPNSELVFDVKLLEINKSRK